jgi:hypothetical protein
VKSIILSLSIGAVAHAQNATPPSPAPRQVGCIRNVIVHTMDPACTVIPDAAVVIGVDGRIDRIVHAIVLRHIGVHEQRTAALFDDLPGRGFAHCAIDLE